MKPTLILESLGLILLATVQGCSLPGSGIPAELQPALTAITPEGLMEPIRVLSSDEFEGRAPGTAGEEKSVGYILGQFRSLGLKPGNPNGTYLQDVPLIGF